MREDDFYARMIRRHQMVPPFISDSDEDEDEFQLDLSDHRLGSDF